MDASMRASTSRDDSPAGRLLQKRGVVYLQELACNRFVPHHWHGLTHQFASRLAPTKEAYGVLRGLACKRWMPACVHQLTRRFAGRLSSYRGRSVCTPGHDKLQAHSYEHQQPKLPR